MARSAVRTRVGLGLVVTAVILLVIFYYPVFSVFRRAITVGGQVSLAPLVAILGDPFYTGVAHTVVADPTAVPAGIADWLSGIRIRDGRLVVPAAGFGLFGFTAYQAFLSTVASVMLGVPGAYVLARYEFPGRETIRSLTILPFVLPGIMVAVGFLAMFGKQGLFNTLLDLVGIGPVELLFSLEIIVLAHAFYNAPLVIRLVSTAWEAVDRRQVETARAAGATRLQVFRDVVVPQLQPAVLSAAVLTFIFTFLTFPIVLALGGLQLATVEVWLFARVQRLALTEAAALGVIETVISLGLTYAYLRYEATQLTAQTPGERLPRRDLFTGLSTVADPRRLAICGYALVVMVVFAGPLVSMILESVTGPTGSLTLANYEFLLGQQSASGVGTTKPVPAIRNSLLFGLATLALAIPMGVVVSVHAVSESRGTRAAEALFSAPLAVSGVVLGLGLLQALVFGTVLFGQRVTVVGPLAIVFAHAVAAYPFVTRNVSPALGQLPGELSDAARSLGASRIQTLVSVELPLVKRALVAGAAFAFAISIGEFDSTVLLAEGVDAYTMPVALERYIGNRSLGPSLGPATAMGTVLLTVTALSFVIIDRVGGRWQP
jgi:thiamine transport system permease protein